MPTWDLGSIGNWELLISGKQEVVFLDGTNSSNLRYRYNPIPPIYTAATTHTLLVGVLSDTALEHWYLGARVSQYLFVSPSPTANLMSGVKAQDTYKAQLGRLNLVEFKNYNVIPYVVELVIPHWIEDVYFEVWQYNGIVGTPDTPNFEQLVQQLNAITQQLASLEQYNS